MNHSSGLSSPEPEPEPEPPVWSPGSVSYDVRIHPEDYAQLLNDLNQLQS